MVKMCYYDETEIVDCFDGCQIMPNTGRETCPFYRLPMISGENYARVSALCDELATRLGWSIMLIDSVCGVGSDDKDEFQDALDTMDKYDQWRRDNED